VFWLIPTIAVYTIVLGIASITSSFADRRGYFAHGCARAWSWLILATTGVDVTVDGLDRIVAGKMIFGRYLEPGGSQAAVRPPSGTGITPAPQPASSAQAVAPPSPIVAKDR